MVHLQCTRVAKLISGNMIVNEKVDVLLILLHDALVDPIVHYQWLL